MSRTTWISLIFLGGGLGLVAYLMFGELHPTLVSVGQETIKSSEAITQEVDRRAKESNDLLERHNELRSAPALSVALSILKSEQERAANLKASTKRLRDLISANNSGDGSAVRDEIAVIQQQLKGFSDSSGKNTSRNTIALSSSSLRSTPSQEALSTLTTYAAWYADVDGMTEKTLSQLSGDSLDQLSKKFEAEAQALTKAFPEEVKLASGIAVRLRELKSLIRQAKEQGAVLRDGKSRKAKTSDLVNTGIELTTTLKTLEKKQKSWNEGLAIVPKDIDKILIDMRNTGNLYEHRYRTITNGTSVDDPWSTVDQVTFTKHRDHLGMTLYSKPAGVWPEDATTIAAPPGYNYIGNKRYGRWERRDGQSFWVFYGQYSMMRDLFWGPGSYRPIYRSEYRSYRDNLSSRRAYFGAKNQYGTAKAINSPKYSNSTYATNKKAAGGYSGSKYSGSKRSGGYRSSRYRGSSFGGGGK